MKFLAITVMLKKKERKKEKRKYMEWKGSNKAVVFHRQHNRVCKT